MMSMWSLPVSLRLQSSMGLSRHDLRGAFVLLIIYYDRVCPCMHYVGPYQTVSLAFYYNVASRVPALRGSVPGYGVARAHVPFPNSVWTLTWSASAQTPSAFPSQDTVSFATVSISTTFLPCRRGQDTTRSASICSVFVSASCPSLDAFEPHNHVAGNLRILVCDAELLADPYTLPRALQRPRHIPRLVFC